jgi:4-hydroxy-tetrahydrodipicolinate reductase
VSVPDIAAPRAVLIGASGRMGRQIVRELLGVADATAPLTLTGAVASAASPALGRDAAELADLPPAGIPIGASLAALLARSDVAIDFSQGSAVASHLAECAAAGVPLLIGATGAAAALDTAVEQAARRIAVLVAPNTSLAVNVLLELVRRAAQALPEAYDIEIVETHHRHKLDAPSGTALALGAAAAEGRGGASLAERASFGRQGHTGARPRGQIGFATLRGGDVVGEHQVWLLGQGESLGLVHRASDRGVFARGAIQAAAWLARQPPGRYEMREYLLSNTRC